MNLDDRIRQAVETVTEQFGATLSAELRAVADEIASAAAAERDQAIEAARAEAAAGAEAAVEQARRALGSERDQAIEEARAKAIADTDAVAEQRCQAVAADHEAALRELEAAAARAREEAVLEARASADAERVAALEAADAEAAAMADAAQTEANTRLAAVRTEANERVARAEAEVAHLAAELAETRAMADRAAVSWTQVAPLTTEPSPVEPLAGDVSDARVEERQADLACIERLLDATRNLDRAASLSDILDSITDYARGEAGRAALFLVHGRRLHGWRIMGFDGLAQDGRSLEIDLDHAGVLTRAVRSGERAPTSDRAAARDETTDDAGVPFLALTAGRAGLAVPVVVGGQVVAVLYADEGYSASGCNPSAWPEMVEIAARHAGRCLELLTTTKAAGLRAATTPFRAAVPAGSPASAAADAVRAEEESARRHARLLLSEIKLYHEAELTAGKQSRDVLSRLKPQIDRARRLYEEKIPPAVRSRVNCFDEELLRTLVDGDASLLGSAV